MGVVAVILGLGLLAILPSGVGLKIVQLVAVLAFMFVWAAVIIKRLHDRNKPALPYAAIFMAPGVLNSIMKIFLIDHTAMDVGGMEFAVPGIWALAVTYVSMAVGLWMLIELGFLKGTPGENRFGSDPLAASNG